MEQQGVLVEASVAERLIQWLVVRYGSRLSLRARRWLAMYYPDARIRRRFWCETLVLLGEDSYFNPGVIVCDDYRGGEILLRVGKRVSVAPGVVFVADSSPNNSPYLQSIPYVRETLMQRESIEVEDDVWIGANATILPGVRVGRGAIVGAGAVVRSNVAPFNVVAGVPAKVIRVLAPFAMPSSKGSSSVANSEPENTGRAM